MDQALQALNSLMQLVADYTSTLEKTPGTQQLVLTTARQACMLVETALKAKPSGVDQH